MGTKCGISILTEENSVLYLYTLKRVKWAAL